MVNPHGQLVAELWHEHALVVCMMYDNMRKQNEHAANEFMYGHILGMTYAMLHADRYPRVTKIDRANGQTELRMVDPIHGAAVLATSDHLSAEAKAQANEILQKACGVTNDNDVG